MFSLRTLCLSLAAMAATSALADDLLDRVDEALTFSAFDDQVRGRFSGLMDLEGYHYTGNAPGFLFTSGNELLNPRLTLFFDAQLGPHIYLFAQSRLDRGFDPQDNLMEMRLDEYAVRWTPWDDGRFSLQVGKFGTIVGNYVNRHLSWENPFVNAPLVYENITSIYDSEVPPSADAFLGPIAVDEKYEYNPVIWGPSYATGVSVSGRLGKFDYAAELKNGALSSRPEAWDLGAVNFAHPTISARIGYRPDVAWNLGLSGSQGSYLMPGVAHELPAGKSLGDFCEQVIAQDISFAWHHWQLWAEVFEARFQVPNTGNADALGYYLEAKYKFTPQLFGALRWNQMFFGTVENNQGIQETWGNDVWRMDAALGWRLTPHVQLKLQYSFQHMQQAREEDEYTHLIATQLTIRF